MSIDRHSERVENLRAIRERIVITSDAIAPQFLEDAVGELEQIDRGILHLSLRGRLSDRRLGELLMIPPGQVAARRDAALTEIAERAQLDPVAHREELVGLLKELPDDFWLWATAADLAVEPESPTEVEPAPQPQAEPEVEAAPVHRYEPAAAPEPEPVPAPADDGAPASGRRRLALPAIAALIAAAIALAFALGSDDEETPRPTSAAGEATAATAAAEPETGPRVALDPVAGAQPVRAVVGLADPGPPAELALSVRSTAPSPGYEVWLYNSVIDSRPLARLPGAGATATFELDAGASEYRYLDVALDRAGFAGHSGRSVARVELAQALAALGL